MKFRRGLSPTAPIARTSHEGVIVAYVIQGSSPGWTLNLATAVTAAIRDETVDVR